ncbi:AAA family ATPase [Streptomyces sp. NPDC126933]|uniref:AAA family ATPase n=1 Tax=unclassified Streptomyces TaxID=2593676 RepID=UPI003651464C
MPEQNDWSDLPGSIPPDETTRSMKELREWAQANGLDPYHTPFSVMAAARQASMRAAQAAVPLPAPQGGTGATSTMQSLNLTDGWHFDLSAIGAEPHLIRDVLERQSAAWLVGPSGSYKSFIALSMAISVATGRPWYGRETNAGPVVYVCSEGSKAWGKRMAAYSQQYGTSGERHAFYMRPAPIEIGSTEWEALGALLEHVRPALVVVDTQAQCATGADENSNSEMARICKKLAAMANRTGAAVLTVHHSGHGKEGRDIRARGASAVYAAADTELKVIPKEMSLDDRGQTMTYVEVEASKQKDMPTGSVVTLAPHVVAIDGATDFYGRPVTSLVMVDIDPQPEGEANTPEQWAGVLYAAGVREAMGRDRLIQEANVKGLEGFPKKAAEAAKVARAHKELIARKAAEGQGTIEE